MTNANFLIVGGAKCGTTSLYKYLLEHHDVFLPDHKEPRFFISSLLNNMDVNDPRFKMFKKGTISSLKDYKKLFEVKESAVGEASAEYLFYYKTAIPNIKKILGDDVKLIIILRDPVERAYSSYLHLYRFGHETNSFEESLRKEEERFRMNWRSVLFYHKLAGLYYEQVKAYMDNFNNVKLLFLDELKESPKKTMKKVYEFIGVTPININPRTHNAGKIPKYTFIHNLPKSRVVKRLVIADKTSLIKLFGGKILSMNYTRNKPVMKRETREYLQDYFKDDTKKLQNIINRNIPWYNNEDGS